MAAALLLRTPDPRPNESVQGYILRVSEINRYDTPWHVLQHAGYEQGETFNAAFRADRLAAILGKDPGLLERHAYWGRSADGVSEYRINGQGIGRGLNYSPLRLTRPAICPACIDAKGMADACWDLATFVACPTHGTRLLERCADCGSALSWYRPGLLVCSCGATLERMPTERASSSVVALMHVIEAKVHGVPVEVIGELDGFPVKALLDMPLESMLRMIAILEKLDANHAEHRYNGVEVVADVLAAWPAGFHAYLRRMGKEGIAADVQCVGLRKRFSRLYQALFKAPVRLQGVEFLHDELVRFGLEKWGESLVDGKLLREQKAQGRYMSAREFAAAIGVMPVSVQRWLDDGSLPGKIIELQKMRRFVIDGAMADGVARDTRARLRAREAAKAAGLPVSVLQELKRSGHYSLSPPVNRRQGFWGADLDALRMRLVATVERWDRASGLAKASESEATMSLGEILGTRKFGGKRAKGMLIAEILDGKVRPVARTDDTPASIRLRVTDIDAFRLRYGIDSRKDTVTVVVASALLRCSLHAVDGLVKTGHLQRKLGSRTGINRRSLEDFQEHWISANALGKELGTNSVGAIGLAKAHGASVLLIPVAGNYETTFIALDDAQWLRDAEAERRLNRKVGAPGPTSAEVLAEHMASLRSYLAAIRDRGESLPMRGGKPNRAAIARACGFSRDTFYDHPNFLAILDRSAVRVAVDALDFHRRALASYLEALRAKCLEVPMRGGRPRLAAIARACGFARNVFYNHPEMLAALEAFQAHAATPTRRASASAYDGQLPATTPICMPETSIRLGSPGEISHGWF